MGEFRKLQQGTKPKTVVPSPVKKEMVQMPIIPRHTGDSGIWWPFRIPGRIWFGLMVMTSPIRGLAMLLDMAVAICVLTIVGVIWAWWSGKISDDTVAEILGQIGERVLSILSKSGLL